MKKYKLQILILLGLSVFFASCKDTPNSDPFSSFDDSVIFSSEELSNKALSGIIVSMAETNSYNARFLPYYGANTDIEFFNNSATVDAKSALNTYTAKPNNTEMNTANNAWAKMYEGIERANLAINGLRKYGNPQPGNVFGQFLGEALTLRAVLYLDLTRGWGDVPARFEPINKDNILMPRVEKDVVYKQVIEDLGEASELLGWPNENKYTSSVGRINKTFAKALRAKYYLLAGGYSQRHDSETPRLSNDPDFERSKVYKLAEKELLEIVDNSNQAGKLDPVFIDIFKKLCEGRTQAGHEALWEIPFSTNRGRMAYTFAIRHQMADQYTTVAQGGKVGPTPNLWYDYDESDLRREVTCIPYTWGKSNPAIQVIGSLKTWNFGKYRYEWMTRVITSPTDDGIKKQYMRMAEVYLMLAEVKNELYGPSEAIPYIKAVRNRAFSEADRTQKVDSYLASMDTKEKMFNAIVDEHAFELAGEMVRKEALIRWNLLGKKMAETKNRLYQLRLLEGPYADVPAKIYYRNVPLNENSQLNEKIEIYGLNRGEDEDVSAQYNKSTTWINTDKLPDVQIESLFLENPDKRQFWPIWQVFIDTSSGILVQYYGY